MRSIREQFRRLVTGLSDLVSVTTGSDRFWGCRKSLKDASVLTAPDNFADLH